MKEGIGDDPFDDEENEDTQSQPSTGSEETAAAEQVNQKESSQVRRSLPYIYSRDSVKEDRQQRPVFLRDQTEEGISNLVDAVEDDLGEDVYQTDVLEAAMEVALDHPELVAQKCREYGYDWE